MKQRLFLILYITFHLLTITNAQEKDLKNYWQVNLQYGFVFEQEPFYRMMAPAHVKAISLEYGILSKGEALWQKVHRFPTFGIGVHYMDLGNDDVLGYAYSMYGFVKYPVFRSKPDWFIGNAQFGLAYLTQKFDVESNFWNLVIGTHFNVYGNLSGDGQIKINDRLFWKYGLGLSHYSNGSFATPNLGINIISVRTGIRFNAYKHKPDYSLIEQLAPFKQKAEFLVSFWTGIREEYPVDNRKYPSFVLNFNYLYALNYDKKLGVGLDLMYEGYIARKIVRLNYKEVADPMDTYRLGAFASYDIVISRFQIFTHIGAYIYNQLHTPTQFLYERVGLNYALSKNWKTTISLKLHYVEADYISMGFAYSFH